MAKAVPATTTRRQLVKIGTAGAPCIALPLATDASPLPTLVARPSPWGRKVLQLVRVYYRMWASPPDEAADPESYKRFTLRTAGIIGEIRAMADEIADRPVRSIADVIDRVIIAVHWRDEPDTIMPALGGILAVAGVRQGECCTMDPDEADERARATQLHRG
jgi:hypothetical protein